ncbi:MAG TPA: RNA polymerase sigma factor [Acidimicrobiales bacterium]
MGDEPVDERDLLVRAAAGDQGAVRRLVDEVGPIVFGYVFARVAGDRPAADDVVQDTFLEALRGATTYRGDARLATWMCGIARHRVLRHFEAERRQTAALEVVSAEVADPSPLDVGAMVDDRDEVVRALGRLPLLHRQVLVLKYLDGEPVVAIAHELDRTPVQVQSLLQRARVALRRELEVGV